MALRSLFVNMKALPRRVPGPRAFATAPKPKDPQIQGNEWDWAKAAFKETAPMGAYFMVFSGFVFIYGFLNPSLDRINNSLNAAAEERSKVMDEIKQSQQRMLALLDPKESQR